MKPVYQNRTGGHPEAPGNCFAACIASILEVPLGDVPDELWDVILKETRKENESDDQFYNRCWSIYWVRLSNWLRERFGLAMMQLDTPAFTGTGLVHEDDMLMIASGKSPRGLEHAVVCRGLNMLHDPHPSGDGLAEDPKRWVFFVPINPAGLESSETYRLERKISRKWHAVGVTGNRDFVAGYHKALDEFFGGKLRIVRESDKKVMKESDNPSPLERKR